jgi:hypothetical protein
MISCWCCFCNDLLLLLLQDADSLVAAWLLFL